MTGRSVAEIVAAARSEGRRTLLEPEGFELLDALGIATPPRLFARTADELSADRLAALDGERVVVKVVAPGILHKRAAGGIRFVARRVDAVREAIESIAGAVAGESIRGFSIQRLVPHSTAPGGELLLTLRWTAEFGPVVACGLGGEHAELLARRLRPGSELAIASPRLSEEGDWRRALGATAAGELSAGGAGLPPELLGRLWRLLARAASELSADLLGEIEINPIVFAEGRPVALDVLVTLAEEGPEPMPPRPLEKIDRLLHPRSMAIVGVSRRANPGRVILENVLRQGFDPDRLYVVRRGADSVEGCPAVPDLDSLPAAVDLLIVGVGARRAREVVTRATEGEKAESMIVISGGLGERAGSEALAADVQRLLARSRSTPGRGPVINGGNCLGIRSQPGAYDALFIPEYKQGAAAAGRPNVALISQSGALLTAKMSCLDGVSFRYAISVGNQLDLTVGDYLTFLKDDSEIDLYALYVEGFRPLDGIRCFEAARDIAARGATVLLYRAGRTAAGARAAASHTAAIAGSYPVTKALAAYAGVVTADSLADFEDLIRLFACLEVPRRPPRRLAVVSNAGFECVAASDSLGGFEPAELSAESVTHLSALLEEHGLADVVGVANPLDLTPMLSDQPFAEAVRIVLEDGGVDAAVIGCVPLTPALETLAPAPAHREDVFGERSLARRLLRLKEETAKPWVAVVDGGAPYRPMAELLRRGGLPTFGTIDRAVRLMGALRGRGDADQPSAPSGPAPKVS